MLKKEFPKGWMSTPKQSAELSYSVLKSDGKLSTTQDVHCDSKKAWSYSNAKATTKFPFSILVGIEDLTFLDFVNIDNYIPRVCIQRGDLLLVRGDIPHRGVESLADHEHYRVHVYCDPVGLKEEYKIDKDKSVPVHMELEYPGGYVYDFASGKWVQNFENEYDSMSDDDSLIDDT